MEDGRDRDLSLLQETRTNTWFFVLFRNLFDKVYGTFQLGKTKMYQWTCDFSSRSSAKPFLTSCEPPPSDTSLLSPPHLLRLLSSCHPENDGQAGQREGFASFPFLATSPPPPFFPRVVQGADPGHLGHLFVRYSIFLLHRRLRQIGVS